MSTFVAGYDNTHAIGINEKAWVDYINRITGVKTIDESSVHAINDVIQIDVTK